ncbi:MAG: hypothetical protein JST24_06865 [Acidobacteria bacterium]|nr:hypothetical protein [Acidobacteriota bacterium]
MPLRLVLPRPILPLLLAPALFAHAPSDPAETRIAWVKALQDSAVPFFTLLRPREHRFHGAWELDPDYSRVAMARELVGTDFEDGEAQAWASRLGWTPGPHWLLLSPDGEALLSGMRTPESGSLLDAMRGTGWRPRFERRASFLREHPDQGDARAEDLYQAGRFASHRAVVEHRLSAPDPEKDKGLDAEWVDKRLTPPDQDQAQWGPAVEAMDAFMNVEGWQEYPHLLLMQAALQVGGAKNSGILKGPIRRFQAGLEASLQARPSDPHLWEAWGTADYLGAGSDPQPLVDDLAAMPRAPWPPLAAAPYLDYAFSQRKDWIGLEALAGRAYADAMSPSIRAYQSKSFAAEVVSHWGFSRLHALAAEGRETEALAFVKELRAAVGRRWPEYASSSLAPSLEFYLGKDDALVKALVAAKDDQAPLDAPQPDPPPPFRLALLGHPDWEQGWSSLAELPAFDAWEPGGELVWRSLNAQEEMSLRARRGWGKGPRWVLMRGGEVLATGATLPRPAFLADRMRAEGLPYLEQLDAFIRVHPDHLEARETRLHLLCTRMPNARLEATLLEDARATFSPFLEGAEGGLRKDWTPRKDLWAPAAVKVMTELESQLARWPERVNLWRAWMDWVKVSGHPRSPTRLMEGLAIWKTRLDGGAGPLSDAVLSFVAARLKDEGRWADLEDWCQAFWEGGVREDLARLALSAPLLDEDQRKGRGEKKERYTRDLLLPYEEALQRLGQAARLKALLQEVSDLDPALAKRLTASSNSPPPGR